MELNIDEFLKKYNFDREELERSGIDWNVLEEIYSDFTQYRNRYDTQADFIANTLRTHPKVHSVKTRIKDPEHLIEKIIRKTLEKQEEGKSNFSISVKNYKEKITDLIGVRVIHIFKEDWEDIHNFISDTWKVIEITANVREGDETQRFMELGIQIKSRKSGYRSVHYLIEFFPTNQKVIAEIQVRTIFEEGYGEIDHQLRYLHNPIPEVLSLNLLLFNRLVGSSDEMASFINLLQRSWCEMEEKYEKIIANQNKELEELRGKIRQVTTIKPKDKHEMLLSLDRITPKEDLSGLTRNFLKTFAKMDKSKTRSSGNDSQGENEVLTTAHAPVIQAVCLKGKGYKKRQ